MQLSAWPTAAHSWETIRDLSLHAEQAGYDGVWVMDHFMENTEEGGGDVHEGFTLLAALAAVVPRVRLGSLVAGNLYRHPAVLANQAASIDHISGGRFVLGLGAGWQENEHVQYGIDLPAPGPRLRRFEEPAGWSAPCATSRSPPSTAPTTSCTTPGWTPSRSVRCR